MVIWRKFRINEHERGLLFHEGEFRSVLAPGKHWFFDPLFHKRVDVVSVRDPWLKHSQLDVIAKSGALEGQAEVIDLSDTDRAIVWINGRLDSVLTPGMYAIWTVFHNVRIEMIDATVVKFEHKHLHRILKSDGIEKALNSTKIESEHIGLYFLDGKHRASLVPGTHAFWRDVGVVKIHAVDTRESVLDISGQEIITSDKVSLRINAVVTYRVTDPLKSVTAAEDTRQSLYRETQLALRKVIGTKELEVLLTDKDAVSAEPEAILKGKAGTFGFEVISFGIRDIILPGEMKDLMNRVTEAKKAAEANFISRREETAAIRSQANTAKILESNPTLMRLRELEVLEKISGHSQFKVVLGEKGLADRVLNLI